jgi:hypothetical protein
MIIDRSIDLHHSKFEPVFGRPIGAFKSDVVALEARIHTNLPAAYREYLLWMGADFNGVFRGSDCFVNHVEENHKGLVVLFKENDLVTLSYCPIVFFMHQGYIACWFDASDQSDDPAVFCFSEATSASGIQAVGTFSDWLCSELLALSEAIP